MKPLILFSFLIFSLFSFAQEFSFPIYFEDAAGNKDTIILGYDANASNGIDAQFGEINSINQPWNGPLDVRIGDKTFSGYNFSGANTFLTKKKILSKDCSSPSEGISIQFYAENLPLKLSWNNSLFSSDTCIIYTCFYNHYNQLIDVTRTGFYLSLYDTLEISNIPPQDIQPYPPQLFKMNNPLTNDYFDIQQYTDNNQQIGITNFKFIGKNTLSKQEITPSKISISPNPASDYISISSDSDIQQIELVDLNGKLILKKDSNVEKIDIRHLEANIYILKIKQHQSIHHFKVHIK